MPSKLSGFQMAILIAILLLGFAVRTYKLAEIPPGFFADEAVTGVDAYDLIKYGTDLYGRRMPIFFQALGEYKSGMQAYLTVPFVLIFGLNEFSVRFTSAFFGVLSILMLYTLVKELFKGNSQNTWIAMFSALFLAISPWHIHFSRIGWDAYMPFLLLTMLGLYFLLKAQNSPKFIVLGVISFALGVYSYSPSRIFIPLFGLGLFLYYFKLFLRNKIITIICFVLLIFLLRPFIGFHLGPEGWLRWHQASIFSNPPSDQSVLRYISTNYLSHFSLSFLFLKGDIDMPGQSVMRHSVRGIGELYLFQLPLILLGIWFLCKKQYRPVLFILGLWLLLYPLGSAVAATKSAQATRSFIGVIPFQIISAVGLIFIWNLVPKRKMWQYGAGATIALIILFSFTHYLNLYFVKYPNYSADFWGWQYGPREIITYFMSVENQYDELLMPTAWPIIKIPAFNAPGIFIPFYTQNTEKGCKKCKLGWVEQYNASLKQLFAVAPSELNQSAYNATFTVNHTVYYPNGYPAFLIGEIVKS